MCEAVDFFSQALAEQGLDAEVTLESGDTNDTFYVSKNIAGTTVTHTTNVSHTEQYKSNHSTEKTMAINARHIAKKFDSRLTETFNWNGRSIEIRPYNEPEAVCNECGASVDLSPRSQLFADSAEMSTPQPMPVTDETIVGSLDDHSMVVLKMHLVGKLRDACDAQCENSNKTRPKDLYRGNP